MKNLPDFLKREWLQILIVVAPFFLVAALWNQLPSSIPIHWNLEGKADSFTNKNVGAFLLPAVNIALCIFIMLLPHIDPRGRNLVLSASAFRIIRLLVTLFLTVMFCTDMLEAAGYGVRSIGVTYYGLLILFAGMGNYIITLRSNYFVGIRTPWTLEDPDVWKKTHRMAGKLWIGASIVFMGMGILLPSSTYGHLVIIFLAIAGGYPILYSYLIYRKLSYHQTREIQ